MGLPRSDVEPPSQLSDLVDPMLDARLADESTPVPTVLKASHNHPHDSTYRSAEHDGRLVMFVDMPSGPSTSNAIAGPSKPSQVEHGTSLAGPSDKSRIPSTPVVGSESAGPKPKRKFRLLAEESENHVADDGTIILCVGRSNADSTGKVKTRRIESESKGAFNETTRDETGVRATRSTRANTSWSRSVPNDDLVSTGEDNVIGSSRQKTSIETSKGSRPRSVKRNTPVGTDVLPPAPSTSPIRGQTPTLFAFARDSAQIKRHAASSAECLGGTAILETDVFFPAVNGDDVKPNISQTTTQPYNVDDVDGRYLLPTDEPILTPSERITVLGEKTPVRTSNVKRFRDVPSSRSAKKRTPKREVTNIEIVRTPSELSLL
jgi:hypothetical protein